MESTLRNYNGIGKVWKTDLLCNQQHLISSGVLFCFVFLEMTWEMMMFKMRFIEGNTHWEDLAVFLGMVAKAKAPMFTEVPQN